MPVEFKPGQKAADKGNRRGKQGPYFLVIDLLTMKKESVTEIECVKTQLVHAETKLPPNADLAQQIKTHVHHSLESVAERS